MRTDESVGSSPAGSEGRDRRSVGGTILRWTDRISSIISWLDAGATLLVLAASLYIGLTTGTWSIGITGMVIAIAFLSNSAYTAWRLS